MELIGDLKKKVENAETTEEAKEAIKEAGMLLDDDELSQVSGGSKINDGDQGGIIDSIADKQKNTYNVYIHSKNKYVEASYKSLVTLAQGTAVIISPNNGGWYIKFVSKR